MGAGRPPIFNNVEDLENKINDYFNTLDETKNPTITGLALYLGFNSRQSLYNYEGKKEFLDTIKIARARIEECYEQMLYSRNCTGAIFALKNFGWRDKQEIDNNINSNGLNIVIKNAGDNNTDKKQ